MMAVEIIEKKTIEKLEQAVNKVLMSKGDRVQGIEYAAVKKEINVYYSAMIVFKR